MDLLFPQDALVLKLVAYCKEKLSFLLLGDRLHWISSSLFWLFCQWTSEPLSTECWMCFVLELCGRSCKFSFLYKLWPTPHAVHKNQVTFFEISMPWKFREPFPSEGVYFCLCHAITCCWFIARTWIIYGILGLLFHRHIIFYHEKLV